MERQNWVLPEEVVWVPLISRVFDHLVPSDGLWVARYREASGENPRNNTNHAGLTKA